MKKGNLIIALIFEGIGIFMIMESFKLEIKSLNDPGAGFFPLLLAISLCLLGLPILFSSFRSSANAEAGKESEDKISVPFGKIGAVIASLIGYGVLLEVLGSLVTFFLLLWGLFWMGHPRKWILVSGLSAFVAALSYLLFVIILQVPFPTGIWR